MHACGPMHAELALLLLVRFTKTGKPIYACSALSVGNFVPPRSPLRAPRFAQIGGVYVIYNFFIPLLSTLEFQSKKKLDF